MTSASRPKRKVDRSSASGRPGSPVDGVDRADVDPGIARARLRCPPEVTRPSSIRLGWRPLKLFPGRHPSAHAELQLDQHVDQIERPRHVASGEVVFIGRLFRVLLLAFGGRKDLGGVTPLLPRFFARAPVAQLRCGQWAEVQHLACKPAQAGQFLSW